MKVSVLLNDVLDWKQGRERLDRSKEQRKSKRSTVYGKEVKVYVEERGERKTRVCERPGTKSKGWSGPKAQEYVKGRVQGMFGAESRREDAKEEERRSVEGRKWEVEMRRVGTGHRVRWVDGVVDGGAREFDLGYSDRKTYARKPGIQAVLDTNAMGLKLIGKGQEGRQLVMNAVVELEKRRPQSAYTGCGRMRKEKVGAKKLKPTKARTK